MHAAAVHALVYPFSQLCCRSRRIHEGNAFDFTSPAPQPLLLGMRSFYSLVPHGGLGGH